MANEYIRKEFDGGVVRTTASGSIASGATTITLTDGSTFPSTNFVIVLDRGLATEEKVLIASRSSNTLTVTQRGYDGSTAQAHSSGAYVEHVVDAYVIDQANAMSTTMTTAGDLIYKTTTGENTAFSRLPIGTSEYVLKSNGSLPTYGQVQTAGLSNNCVTEAKIAVSVAGNGLLGGNGTALAVNVAAAGGLEIASDQVQIKVGGVTETMLADNAVTTGKIADGTIVNADISASAAIAYTKLNLANSITSADLAANSVDTSEIAALAVTNAKVEDNTLTLSKMSAASGELNGAWIDWDDLSIPSCNADWRGKYMKIGRTFMFTGEFYNGGNGTSTTAATYLYFNLPSGFEAITGWPQGVTAMNVLDTISARVDPTDTSRIQVAADLSGGTFANNTNVTSVRVNGTILLLG